MSDSEREKIIPIAIEDEMKKAYLTYAMSVIVSRALPDVRDGLKPVHRRILYAMNGLGVLPDRPYKKSAAIVGEVLGKYHPHGDMSVYNALVRMAQDFSMRYLLIKGQGNFGSVDGDMAAAMRYTETRITHFAHEMLRDIQKETVDMSLNYDDSLEEPVVLPSYIPNLLVNGATGIAVGMATSIPPHNLREVIDATIAVIDNFEIETEELLKYIKGPDFPTYGIIYNSNSLREAYMTGRGKVRVRGNVNVEAWKSGKEAIIIDELPYQVNKAELIIKIANHVKAKRIEGIGDIRDESDRSGMRIVLELKRGANPGIILNRLYAHTALQSSFSIIMLALVDGTPKVLSLKEVIEYYIGHRKEVLIRRTGYDLDKAQKRAHIVEGLLIALKGINEVIKLIRGSKDTNEARNNLMEQFKLTEEQSKAILEMRLQRLTALESSNLEKEYAELTKFIDGCKELLEHEELQYKNIKQDLLEMKKKYGDKRRTKIEEDIEDIDKESLIEEEQNVVTLSHRGFIKRLPVDTYKRQKRGGVGITGVSIRDDDFNEHIFISSTHDYIMFFSNKGRTFYTKVYDLPEGSRIGRGKKLNIFLRLEDEETIRACLTVKSYEESPNPVVLITKKGIIKRTMLSSFVNAKIRGIKAINLDNDDELVSVVLTDGNSELVLCTKEGKALKVSENDIRQMGRNTRGVIGIRVKGENELIGMVKVEKDKKLFVITKGGYGKLLKFSELKKHGRGTGGQIYIKVTDKTGLVSTVHSVGEEEVVVISTSNGMIVKTAVKGISSFGRTASGVKVVNVKGGDHVVSVASATYDEEAEQQDNGSEGSDGIEERE